MRYCQPGDFFQKTARNACVIAHVGSRLVPHGTRSNSKEITLRPSACEWRNTLFAICNPPYATHYLTTTTIFSSPCGWGRIKVGVFNCTRYAKMRDEPRIFTLPLDKKSILYTIVYT